MPAYFVAEITRIILYVYTERRNWRNVTPGECLAPSLGNRKQMLSSWPSPPSSCAPFSSSVHLSTVLISKPHKDMGCGNTLTRGALNQVPGFRNKLVPRNRGLLAIKSLFCCPHLGWTACFHTQIWQRSGYHGQANAHTQWPHTVTFSLRGKSTGLC